MFSLELLATQGDSGVARARWSGPGDELGGEWEADRLFLYTLMDDKLWRGELFELDDRDTAMQKLRETAASVRFEPGVPVGDVSRLALALGRAIVLKDWDGVRAVYLPDAQYVDRRAGLRVEVVGDDKILEAIKTFAENDDVRVDFDVLASDARSLALVDVRYSGSGQVGAGEWEMTRLAVTRFEHDRFAELVLFDEGDVLSALTEMSAAGALMVQFVHTYNERDWAGLQALFADDVEVRDKRSLGWGDFTGNGTLVARLRDRVDLAPDIQISIDACPVVTERGGLFHMPMLGHLADGGGEFEGDALCLIEVSGDRVVRLQVFEPGELVSVAERFEELTTPL